MRLCLKHAAVIIDEYPKAWPLNMPFFKDKDCHKYNSPTLPDMPGVKLQVKNECRTSRPCDK